MNKKLIYIITSAILLFAGNSYAQSYDRAVIQANEAEIRQQNNTIQIGFDMVVRDYAISPNNQLIVTPVIEGKEGKIIELPDVIINGKRRDNLYRRLEVLDKNTGIPSAYQVVRAGKEPLNVTIPYQAETAYEEWMDGAMVYLRTDMCGCGGAIEGYSGILIHGTFQIPEAPVFSFDYTPSVQFIAPEAEAIKNRTEGGTALITYKVNSSVVMPALNNNSVELDKIQNSLQYVKSESTAEITSIAIQAYASPEGSAEANKRLSQRRADALRDYVSRNYGIPAGQISSEGMGENWDGLVTLVENDPLLESKDEVLRIIRTVGITDGREKQLMQLSGGRPYRDMLNRLFPQLRRSDYKIEFTVPDFTVEKGKELLKTRPGLLSLNEMYHIANTYEEGSDEFNKVFDTAVMVYPDDPVANLNVAATALLKGDSETARTILEKYGDRPEAYNNLGVLLMEQHRFEEAESYLKKARDNGSQEAVKNLAILPELRQAVSEYEAGKTRYERFKQ